MPSPFITTADSPDSDIASNVSRPFMASLNSVAANPSNPDQYVYTWVEQSFNAATGDYEDAPSGRHGDTINGPFAVEINNYLVTVFPIFASLVLRGIVDGQPFYEFTSPSFRDTYTALAVTEIPASGGEPTSGTVLVYAYNNITGEMNDTSEFSMTVYSLWDIPIEVCQWVHLALEPFSGQFFVYSIPGTSGCGHIPTGSGDAKYYCLSDPTGCDFTCYGQNTGMSTNTYLIINSNTLNGADDSIISFNPGITGTQTSTLDFTVTTLPPFGTGTIGDARIIVRGDCPATCYFSCQWFGSMSGGVQTIGLTIAEIGGAGSTISASLPDIADGDNLQIEVVDNGTSIVLSCFNTTGPTLLGTCTLTTSEICGTYMGILVSIGDSGGAVGYASHLTVTDGSGVTWDDGFVDSNGTQLIDHTADVGCDSSSGSGGSGSGGPCACGPTTMCCSGFPGLDISGNSECCGLLTAPYNLIQNAPFECAYGTNLGIPPGCVLVTGFAYDESTDTWATAGPWWNYAVTGSGWDCNGVLPLTLHKVSTSGPCANWPATVTITPGSC